MRNGLACPGKGFLQLVHAKVVDDSAPPRLELRLPEIGGANLLSAQGIDVDFMKHFRSTHELIELLQIERGLEISDSVAAESFLRRTNYYRFTGYSRYFQIDPGHGNNNYEPEATFEEICELIARDDELRMSLFVVLAEIEMSVRARFAHLSGRFFGEAAFYLNRDGDDISKVPVWVAVEVLSFGKVSWIIDSIQAEGLREDLADYFGYSRATFPRVIHSLAALRNSCAHHSQLWHRNLTIQCPLPLNKRERPRDIRFHEHGLYPAVLAMRKLTRSASSRSQLSVIERGLRDESVHSTGLLVPQGVR
ncbi:Abi family protein [Leucobacter sp. HY1908]